MLEYTFETTSDSYPSILSTVRSSLGDHFAFPYLSRDGRKFYRDLELKIDGYGFNNLDELVLFSSCGVLIRVVIEDADNATI